MGSYVNPPDQTKEDFLRTHGSPLEQPPTWEEVPVGMLPVCWVHNGYMTAAGIAYCPQELEEFINDMGGRPYKWFIVPTKLLVKVSNLKTNYSYWSNVPEAHRE